MEPGHPVMNGMGNKEISLEKKKQQQGYSINFSTLVGRDRKKNFVTFFYLLSELERFLEALVVHKTSETLDGVQGSDIQVLHRGIGG